MFLFADGGGEMALHFRLSGALYDIEDISAKLEILGADKGAKMALLHGCGWFSKQAVL